MSDLRLSAQNSISAGLCPRHHLQRYPDPLAVLNRPTSKGREDKKRKEGKGRKGKERESRREKGKGKGNEKGKGRGGEERRGQQRRGEERRGRGGMPPIGSLDRQMDEGREKHKARKGAWVEASRHFIFPL